MGSVCGLSSRWRCWVTPDDSLSDRLHRLWTSCGLMICFCILGFITYLGNPIQCWCPAHFSYNHCSWVGKVCWMNSSHREFNKSGIFKDDSSEVVAYYKWVPIILLCQALLCLLPYIFWRIFNTLSPLRVTAMIRSARRGQYSCSETERKNSIQYLSNTWKSDMKSPGGRERNQPGGRNIKQPQILGVVYLLTKLFNIINCSAQLVFLDWFLKWDKYHHGFRIIEDLIKGRPWSTTETLPRVIMCDFSVRRLGNIQSYMIECTLPINELAEWMFLLIWFWFSLLLLINISSFIYWTLAYIKPYARKTFLMHHLKACGIAYNKRSLCADWLIQEMSRDSALTLALFAENIDDVMVCEVISAILRHDTCSRSSLSSSINDIDFTPTKEQSLNGQEENIPLNQPLSHEENIGEKTCKKKRLDWESFHQTS